MIFNVNGHESELEIEPQARLSDVLRGQLGLTGTKIGCGDGQCGSCVVLVDGRPIRSCSYPAGRASGKQILTIEGLAASWGEPGELHPIQRAFIEHGAVQCGFCTPGLLMQTAGLWQRVIEGKVSLPISDQDIKRALGKNSCRCTGYVSVFRAVHSAFHELETGVPLPPMAIETLEPLYAIGHSLPHPEVKAKVTGKALYADDYVFSGMLFGATLRAEFPHARILSIDTDRAKEFPGVRAVLTHKDIPGSNRHGLVYADWPILCDDKVRYLGDAVAIVAADTPEIAHQALELIDVSYQPLPVIDGPEAARQADAVIVHEEWKTGNLLEHIKVRRGDVDKGFEQADVVVEQEYRTPTYEHLFMEPECSIGVPAGFDDEHPMMTVYVGSQIPYADRDQIAAAMGLEPDRVRIKGTLIGGGFGGKEDIMGQIHAALLAQTTGCPVKILYDRTESMLVHPKRHATAIRIKTGARFDGTLTAVKAELLGDAGAYASLSTKVLKRATTHASGPYEVPHVKIDCYAMYTNNPPSGAFRGFGVTQSAFAVECNMDLLADELGMDPIAFRKKNALRVGSTTATGQVLRESAGLVDCIDWVAGQMARSPLPDPTDGVKVGWGVAAAYKNTGFGGGAPDAAGAEVEVYTDGTAEVRSSSADLGQGLATVLAQITAEELGLPYSRVRVLLSDTARTPDGGATTASRQTYVTGNAACLAARAMRDSIASVASERWNQPPDRIEFVEGELVSPEQTVSIGRAVAWLQEEGRSMRSYAHYHAPKTLPLGEGGDMHFAYSYGFQAAQVAVDERTGQVTVLRIIAACDGGRALNPQAMLGQIEGSLVMGIGTALTEEYRIEKGVPLTRKWADYSTPSIHDMPEMAVRLIEHPTADGPYGAKGIGELPSIPTAPAICNAIYRATGVRTTQLPVRSEDLIEA